MPLVHAVAYYPDTEIYFQKLHQLHGCAWMDSGKPRTYSARYDIISALPREQIMSQEDRCEIHHRDGSRTRTEVPALVYLQTCLDELARHNILTAKDLEYPFTGGAIGYLGYEAMHDHFQLASKPDASPSLPDIYFGIYDWALIQDHLKCESHLWFLADCPSTIVDQVKTAVDSDSGVDLADFNCGELLPDITPADYMAAVDQVLKYIYAGDCYQTNFTQRFVGKFSGSTATAYIKLRQALSGPFSAYLDTPAGAVLSLSPERFVEVDRGQVKTQPIKGTAPRGASLEEDAALANELRSSEKNRAENVMIVDLLRNDLSKVCQPFSVKVPELFSLQSFTNVHHLVSTVTGTLCEKVSHFDLLRACFPGGSITGAPKKRAMQIIDELEHTKRSVYCGSVVYMSLNGRMDSNIAIRTLVQADEKIYCWGGGGIVADSDPALEYQESLHKIQLLLDTLN